jgi:uncharacterized caspase-like protein
MVAWIRRSGLRAGARLCVALCLAGVAMASLAQVQQVQPPAGASKRALVIGNAAYAEAPLSNPGNDATDMTRLLEGMGYAVRTVRDGSRAQMLQALSEHAAGLGPGTLSLVYFAGHGVQIGGRNFLVPVDARPRRADDLLTQGVSVDEAIALVARARPRFNVLILDACRDNPFGDTGSGGGLAPLDAPADTLIAFATAPGKVAADGSGRNGLYTSHLLRHLAAPAARVEAAFKLVRVGVLEDSAGAQLPWENTALTAELGLAAWPQPVVMPAPAPAAPAWLRTAGEPELRRWLSQNSDPQLRQPVLARLVALREAGDLRQAALSLAERACADCPRLTPVAAAAEGGQTLWVGSDLVTQREWGLCVAAKACPALQADGDDKLEPALAAARPAAGVSATAAARYIAWLSGQAPGWRFRLPTEAEWQRVHRSGYFDERGRPIFGNNSACQFANLYDQNGALAHAFDWPALPCFDGFAEAAPVGLFMPSGDGLFDLLGNLWQWTSTCADGAAAACSRQRLVGGSWATGKNWSWERPPTLAAEPDLDAPLFGLRVVATRP